MMRALIVDDEIHSRDELEAMLLETGEFTIIGKCGNAVEALQEIKDKRPDVLFLDIQMPVISGFELLGMIDENQMPAVVFVTAYDEYALKAFEENTLDYLLKPVDKIRLGKTVRKLKKIPRPGERPSYATPEIKKIPCLLASRIKLINTADVDYVKSNEAGVYVVCPAGEFFTDLTLRVLEHNTSLVRCHKQYLVNIDRVDEIVLHENMLAEIRTKSGRTIPVSRRHLKDLREKLNF
ncbi:MAG TPA: two-component system response regulator BtsR [Syntrophales bacterium]|nr:two-component system response regulator BtsR [Syntrophales bacterium]